MTKHESVVIDVQAEAASRRMVVLIQAAEAVFADQDDADAFLSTPHPELDGQTPLQAARSEEGAARVERVLHALVYGLPV